MHKKINNHNNILKRIILYKEKIHNIDRDKISIKTIEEEFKNMFGNKINVSNLENLSNLCENLIKENNVSGQLVDLFAKKYLSNLDNSAYFASNYLINKSKSN